VTKTTTPILLLGKADSGKTHFSVVLIEKLKEGLSSLHLAVAPEDLTVFEEPRRAIQQGRLAPHTKTAAHGEASLPLRTAGGRDVRLVLPDYSGEDLKELVSDRRVSEHWLSEVRAASQWVIMIRPHLIEKNADIMSQLRDEFVPISRDQLAPKKWNEGAWWTELLQMLLEIAGVSLMERAPNPRLAVLLSCWDELSSGEQSMNPRALLAEKAPLFAEFIDSNWDKQACKVWGVSSLGRTLSMQDPDEDYVNKGPASQGFSIQPNGKKEALDAPILWILGEAS